ncbi:MAG: DEAD/DEAH box helicase family protein [Deltaproteobacteria bacterium]|nr:DEAD/DEAH box helicase family protein [Deltaproteobacteria bacterium]
MTTPYHAKYWAYELQRTGPAGTIESIGRSMSNAKIELHPYQVDAAIFALKSPLQKGVMLADEVGLGKTIEAGLVIAQRWAEGKRKIMLILPATLRMQWRQELETKFFVPAVVLDSKNYKAIQKAGHANPFTEPGEHGKPAVILSSYQFIWKKAAEVAKVDWDLVVIDEAHRLRNVYKGASRSRQATAIRSAISGCPKILLTATPLQNDLKELWGLASIADESYFGSEKEDLKSFTSQYRKTADETTQDERNEDLRMRLRQWCKRTLRQDVTRFVKFTTRHSITQDFTPTEEEQEVYELVSRYLDRGTTWAFPGLHKKLKELMLRKLLASSTFAIGATLQKLQQRLENCTGSNEAFQEFANSILGEPSEDEPIENGQELTEDIDDWKETEEDWTEKLEEEEAPEAMPEFTAEMLKRQLLDELEHLSKSASKANSIAGNAKGEALLEILPTAFDTAEKNYGAARKVVIFTESKKTQEYLFDLLETQYAGQIVLISGTNTDNRSQEIYKNWLERHQGSSRITGIKPVDVKAAIVEEFKERGTILIATEAAAEGVNLQFCSLLVNYDLPWNPQRVEQRIGRVHRFGQKYDVLVVNFINTANTAERRVFQLLDQKFKLFNGVFGASDEILGTIESGVDIEKRIIEIMSTCRTEDEINAAFDELQSESREEIEASMKATRETVLRHLDTDVQSLLNTRESETRNILDKRTKWLMDLTRHELGDSATFSEDGLSFRYPDNSGDSIFYYAANSEPGRSDDREGVFYRSNEDLAVSLIEQAIGRELQAAQVNFTVQENISQVVALHGKTGWLAAELVSMKGFREEQKIVFSGIVDSGERVSDETCRKLFQCPATTSILSAQIDLPDDILSGLALERQQYLKDVDHRNQQLLVEEMDKTERWAEDSIRFLERELTEMKEEIRAQKRRARLAPLEERMEIGRKVLELEKELRKKRSNRDRAEMAIEERKEKLLDDVQQQLNTTSDVTRLFAIRWTVEVQPQFR